MQHSNKWLMVGIATMLASTAAKGMELGPVEGWKEGAADIIVYSGSPPSMVGKIDADGRVELDLQEASDSGQSLSDLFTCPYEGEITISAPDAVFSAATNFLVVRMAEEEMIGTLMAFSSPVYAEEWEAALAKGDNAPEGGSTFELIHVSEPVRVEGNCEFDLQIDGSGTTPVKIRMEYAMEFDSGWQLVETETRATATSSLGITWAVDTLIRAAAIDSDRVDWVVLLER